MTYPPLPVAPAQPARKRKSLEFWLWVVGAPLLLVLVAAVTFYASQPDAWRTGKVRVAWVMEDAGCTDAQMVETETFAYETGKCQIAGAEVTFNLFETPDQLDRFVKLARIFGGNYAAGDGWLAYSSSLDAVTAVADALDGKVL